MPKSGDRNDYFGQDLGSPVSPDTEEIVSLKKEIVGLRGFLAQEESQNQRFCVRATTAERQVVKLQRMHERMESVIVHQELCNQELRDHIAELEEQFDESGRAIKHVDKSDGGSQGVTEESEKMA